MKYASQRRVFTTLMTIFATTFVIAITSQVLGGEADLIADIIKIASLIAVSTAVISFIVWTALNLKKASVMRGALSGFFTTVLVIPLPTFIWTLKTQTFVAYGDTTKSLFTALFSALPTAINAGLYTFVDITKASLTAVIASMVLGAVVASYVKPEKPKG